MKVLLEGELEKMIKYLIIQTEDQNEDLLDDDLKDLYFFIKNKIVTAQKAIDGLKCADTLMKELQDAIFRYIVFSAPFPIYGRKLEPIYRTLILNEYFKWEILPICDIKSYISLAPDYGAIEVMNIIDDSMRNRKVLKFDVMKEKIQGMRQESKTYLKKRLEDYKFLQELRTKLENRKVRLNEKDESIKRFKLVEQNVAKLYESKSPLELVSFLNTNDNRVQMNVKTISDFYTYIPNILSKELIWGALVLLSNSYLSFQIFKPDMYMLTFDRFEDMLKLAMKKKPTNRMWWTKTIDNQKSK